MNADDIKEMVVEIAALVVLAGIASRSGVTHDIEDDVDEAFAYGKEFAKRIDK